MLTEKQTERMLDKLKQFEETLENLMFRPVEEVSMGMYQTSESLDRMPDRELFHKAKKGDIWGGEGKYCWFAGDFVVPEYLDGKDLYLKPEIGGYEAMLWSPVWNLHIKNYRAQSWKSLLQLDEKES